MYCDLKLHCPHLKHLNIGGGIGSNLDKKKPGKTRETIAKIVGVVKKVCQSRSTEVPNIFTEFGHYTVAESSGVLGTVTQTKARTKKSLSYIVDFSVINLMPDIGIASSAGVAIKAFPLNLIQNKQVTAELSGLTCDSDDHSEPHHNMTFPEINAGETLHVGFFNTGSYQDDVSGYTGLHLCMLPNPRHVILKKNERGQIKIELFSEEQSPQQIMKILGY